MPDYTRSAILHFGDSKSEDYNESSINQEVEFSRYILYTSGKSRCYQDTSFCKKIKKARSQSLMEICFHTPVAFGIYELLSTKVTKGLESKTVCIVKITLIAMMA